MDKPGALSVRPIVDQAIWPRLCPAISSIPVSTRSAVDGSGTATKLTVEYAVIACPESVAAADAAAWVVWNEKVAPLVHGPA